MKRPGPGNRYHVRNGRRYQPIATFDVAKDLDGSIPGRRALMDLGWRKVDTACDVCQELGGSVQPCKGGFVFRSPYDRTSPGCKECPKVYPKTRRVRA